jgi:hypothetical protein
MAAARTGMHVGQVYQVTLQLRGVERKLRPDDRLAPFW